LPVQYVDVSAESQFIFAISPLHSENTFYRQIISNEGIRPPIRKPTEGQARARYNFVAQSDIELSLNKGELVSLTRRVDPNWFEGRIGSRKGIFPVSYVDVLTVSSS
jgi:sorbin and SH3 domain-containing protein 1